jgi:lambda repressor-like predicted transcriptional regulator
VLREANRGASVENPANPSFLPDNLPQTPASQEIGNIFSDCQPPASSDPSTAAAAHVNTPTELATSPSDDQPGDPPQLAPSVSCHDHQYSGNETDPPRSLRPPRLENSDEAASDTDPLTDLLHRALKAAAVHTGRPRALDDQAKGQLIALLSVGMSMRQAAAVLGVSHTTIQNVLKADPALGESITAARFQAQLQPLACVIREARRSWKAATWLLKYLDGKIASHEETPDERRQRQNRETDEFFGRSPRNVKHRKTLG